MYIKLRSTNRLDCCGTGILPVDATAFDDILIGDEGNNWLYGNAGVDYFDGGEGIDTVNFIHEKFAINADLSQNRATYINNAGTEVVETLINIENLGGTAMAIMA